MMVINLVAMKLGDEERGVRMKWLVKEIIVSRKNQTREGYLCWEWH